MESSLEDRVVGRLATCHRCQSTRVPVFGRDVFGMSRVELCRKCIADLDLAWPVNAFDRPEPEPEFAPMVPVAGLTARDMVVVALFAILAVVAGLAVSSLARSLSERIGLN